MLYVARGTLLTPLRVPVTLYNFQLVMFDNTVVDVYKAGETFSSSTPEGQTAIVAKFQNIKNLLIFRPFEDTTKPTTAGSLEKNVNEEKDYVGDAAWETVKKMSSGQLSKNGSVIPRILFPMANNANYLDNGLISFLTETVKDENGNDVEIRKENLEYKITNSVRTPANWSIKCEHKKAGRPLRTGISGYLTNEDTFDSDETVTVLADGSKIVFSRSYTLAFDEGYKRGAFAIMIGFSGNPPIEDKYILPEARVYINTAPEGEENTGTSCEARVGYNGDIMLNLANGSMPPVYGKLSDNKECSANMTVPQKYLNSTLEKAFVIVFYPVLNGFVATSNFGSNKDDSGVKAQLVKDYGGLSGMLNPSIKDFPTKYKETDPPGEIKIIEAIKKQNGRAQRFEYSNQMDLAWLNCWGSFAYCPVHFSNRVVFDYYFKTGDFGTGNEKLVSEGVTTGVETRVVFYAIPIFADNGGDYKISKKVKATRVYSSSETNTGVYKFNFSMATSATVSREVEGETITEQVDVGNEKLIPGEMFGFVMVTEHFGTISKAKCDDGEFTQSGVASFLNNIQSETERFSGSDASSTLGASWFEYIKSVNFSFSHDSVSGTMTLDKFSMKGGTVYGNATQSIGAVSFTMKNSDGTSELGKISDGVPLFRGYAMEVSDGASGGTGDFTVGLYGIQKKLEDMKLINCPFWDGDRLFGKSESDDSGSIIQYIKNYTGCRLYCRAAYTKKVAGDDKSVDIKDVRVPSSSDYSRPAIDFGNTTSALEAIQQLAAKCNHKFVVQPDGCGYFYQLDKYGVPHWVNDAANIPISLDRDDVISYSLNPFLENRYNHYVTRALIHDAAASTDDLKVNSEEGGMIESKTDDVGDGMDFPWARFSINALQGFLTKEELQYQHDILVRKGLGSWYQGSIKTRGLWKIDGNVARSVWIYDKVTFQGVTFMVLGVENSFDSTSKRWDTELSVAYFKPYDSSGTYL